MSIKTDSIKPYQKASGSKKHQVEAMFDNISGNYDLINRLITFGMDKKWRKRVLKLLQKNNPNSILDIATGTGDMAILFSKTNAQKIVGVDISKGMLQIASKKIKELKLDHRIEVEVQDSEALTFEDNSFDAASVTYGIRNFENLEQGLSEIRRVLTQNGVFVILETSVPENKFIRAGYLFYTKQIMPRLARLFSKDKQAYSYLSDSAINFPHGKELKQILEQVGFTSVQLHPQFFGASTIYFAQK